MKIVVPREIVPGERRVALIPDTVEKLAGDGTTVVVESGAGTAAGFPDAAYEEAGATVAGGGPALYDGADVVLKVQAPAGTDGGHEVDHLPEGVVLIAFLDPLTSPELVKRLRDAGVTALAMETVPRITRAQKMDALSSQATVAGYKAALLAADTLGKFLPMLTTAAGTIRPSRILILGAGVAGLQAIATGRRLGARVSAFDVRPAVKEQVESLGATFLEAELDEAAEDKGGYAKELSEEQHERELRLIADHIGDADIVITTARIPGRDAPVLVTEEMVRSMKPGSVIVDLASASGGNCVLTEMGERVERHGVTIMGPLNLPAEVPFHASQMYAKNITALLEDITEEGAVSLDFDDEVVAGACITHGGEIRHQATRERVG